MQALALLLLLILIGAIVAGFVMYSKIPDNAPNNEQNLALAFASIGIMFPPLQVVPIVIGAKHMTQDSNPNSQNSSDGSIIKAIKDALSIRS